MIEVLLNDVTLDGDRRVRVVSDAPICVTDLPLTLPSPLRGEDLCTWCDDLLGLHYLEATWICREAIRIRLEGWKADRDFVLWKLEKGERVREALNCAVGVFGAQFKCFAAYAFMKKMPKGIESGFEVEDVMLIEAEWVPAGCIALCTSPLAPLQMAKSTQFGEGNGE